MKTSGLSVEEANRVTFYHLVLERLDRIALALEEQNRLLAARQVTMEKAADAVQAAAQELRDRQPLPFPFPQQP